VIRLVDSLVVQKGEDGERTALQWSDLSIAEGQDMGALAGALVGVGRGGEADVDEGIRAGRAAGAQGHLLDDPEDWNVADAIRTVVPRRSRSSITSGRDRCVTPLCERADSCQR
jgi:hypothetical protein